MITRGTPRRITTVGAKGPWWAALVSLTVAGCGDTGSPTRPAPTSPEASFVVSSPSTGSSVGLRAGLVYVSLPPGAFPDAVAATIRSRATGSSVTVPLVDGGFDPVPVFAAVGDSIEVEVRGPGSASAAYVLTVSAASRPILIRTVPPPHKRDVALNARLTAVFSEPMDSASLVAAITLWTGGHPVPGAVVPIGGPDSIFRADFVPAALLDPGTTYQLRIGLAATARTGGPIAAPGEVEFVTGTAAELEATADSLDLIPGWAANLAAEWTDARGVRIRDIGVAWSSSDSSVVMPPVNGQVHGGRVGVATLTARLGDLETRVAVRVRIRPGVLTLALNRRDGPPAFFELRLDGSGPSPWAVQPVVSNGSDFDVSPNGKLVYECPPSLCVADRSGATSVYPVSLAGSPEPWRYERYLMPAWHPDGRRVVLNDGDGQARIIDLATMASEPISVPGLVFYRARIAPTGGAMAMTVRLSADDIDAAEIRIRDDSGVHPVTTTGWNPVWGPNQGELTLASDEQVKVVSGYSLSRVIRLPGDTVRLARWAPDGSQLAVAVNRDVLVLARPDGSGQVRFQVGRGVYYLGGLGWARP